MRLRLAEIDYRRSLIAQRDGAVVSLAASDLPANPLSILLDDNLATRADTPLFMKAGEVCEVEVQGIGVLRNSIVDEPEA